MDSPTNTASGSEGNDMMQDWEVSYQETGEIGKFKEEGKTIRSSMQHSAELGSAQAGEDGFVYLECTSESTVGQRSQFTS